MRLGALTMGPDEWAILRHRLEVPEAIADALEEDYHPDDVEVVARFLLGGDWRAAAEVSEGMALAVLVDCIEGSTYSACVRGEANPAALRDAERVGRSLARKVSRMVGRRVEFPTA